MPFHLTFQRQVHFHKLQLNNPKRWVDEINEIFTNYAFDGAFGIKDKLTLISVTPFSQYLDQHPEVKLLNFSAYKKIQNIATVMQDLVNQLNQKGCLVKTVAFDSGLKEEVTAVISKISEVTFQVKFPEVKKK